MIFVFLAFEMHQPKHWNQNRSLSCFRSIWFRFSVLLAMSMRLDRLWVFEFRRFSSFVVPRMMKFSVFGCSRMLDLLLRNWCLLLAFVVFVYRSRMLRRKWRKCHRRVCSRSRKLRFVLAFVASWFLVIEDLCSFASIQSWPRLILMFRSSCFDSTMLESLAAVVRSMMTEFWVKKFRFSCFDSMMFEF